MRTKKVFYRAVAVLAATELCFTCLFGCSRETRNEDTYPAELDGHAHRRLGGLQRY